MPRKRIAALILDYGGVISKPQDQNSVVRMLDLLGLEAHPDAFEAVYRKTRGQYDSGELSAHDYWVTIFDRYGLAVDEKKITALIEEDVQSWTDIDPDMLAFIEARKAAGCRLAIISNMTWETLDFMRRNFPWLALFEELVFSCELGISKPDKRIYAHCLHRLKLSASACLFVDDSTENVAGAHDAGLHAIHFQTHGPFLREIEAKYTFLSCAS
jgi:putative hydrolase of the HAD superfamily